MPGPKTHEIFYKQLKTHLCSDVLSAIPNYEDYSIFAQGHDFLIYHNFFKLTRQDSLHKKIELSKQLQENSFVDFIFEYLNTANNTGILNNPAVKAFIGPGYIAHHILDAYTHPFIIYYAGDHVRDVQNKTWQHGIVEKLIDIRMMSEVEGVLPCKHHVEKDFEIKNSKHIHLLEEVIDKSMNTVYGFRNAGRIFVESFSQIKGFMYFLKYDPIGIKRLFFDFVDPLAKGSKSFSYHHDPGEATKYLNEKKEVWCNPMDENLQSRASFQELYNRALKECARIINELEPICASGIINKSDICKIVPDIASTHGLACGQSIEIKYIKKWE